MNPQKLKPFLIVFIFLLASCSFSSKNELTNNTSNEILLSQYSESIGGNEESLVSNFSSLTSTGNIKDISNFIKEDNFKEIQLTIPKVVEDIEKNHKNLSKDEKLKVQALKYIQVSAILNEGNYFYKEKEKSKEAVDFINEMVLKDPDYIDPFYSNYYLGYAKEITKDYSGALNHYEIALKSAPNIEKNKIPRSIILTQIGHVYDLRGDKTKAYDYYIEAYNLNNRNFKTTLNIARYLSRTGDFESAKLYFEYSLLTPSKKLKSEIYYSLSSIELELNGLNVDIDKSIDYAKKSIEFNENYPMGYLALARGYYMLNDVKYNKDIEDNLNKSIKLNPYGNEAYRYLACYNLDNGNLDEALKNIDKSKEVIDKDMILMDDQRIQLKYLNDVLKVYISFSKENLGDIYEIYKDERLKNAINLQLKRKNYGIYKNISNEKKFQLVINYYK